MKTRTIIPLVIGLAIGVFAIRYFVNVVKKAKGASTDMVEVICAGADITPSVEIKGTMLEVKSIPKVAAPKLYLGDRKEVEGRVAAQFIPAGQPIVQGLLAPKGTLPGLAVRIPHGMRAVSVQVDESAGVAGWLRPGSRVDVIAVMTGRTGADNETISKLILQNVEILAVGQDSGAAKNDSATSLAKTVTLAVTPTDMPGLHLATSKGKIRLAMRSQTDDSTQQKTGLMTDNQLLGIKPKGEEKPGGGFLSGFLSKLPKPEAQPTDKEASAPKPEPVATHTKPQPAPAEKVTKVEMIYGSSVSEVFFKGEGRNQTRVTSSGKGRTEPQPAENEQPQPEPTPADGG